MSLNYTTDAITTYGGPYPAEGSGAHRYTILLLPQPTAFQSPADLSTPGVRSSSFKPSLAQAADKLNPSRSRLPSRR